MNRNTITVMSGQVVDFFDNDFRELYAVSDKVDLYREFHISKPALPVPVLKTPAETNRLTVPVSTSRFQISVGDSRQGDLKVPAHKYHNPKYSLVVGNSLGVTGSLQDLSKLRDYVDHAPVNNMEKLIHTNGDSVRPQSPTSPDGTEDNKGDGKKLLQFGSKKQRSSFRHFLKGRANNQSPDTLSKTTHQSTKQPITDAKQISHTDTKVTSNSKEVSWLANHVNEREDASKHITPAPRKISESDSTGEVEDTFEFIENPPQVKFKLKKNKMGPRSVSLQTIATDGEDGMYPDFTHVQYFQEVPCFNLGLHILAEIDFWIKIAIAI